MDPVRRASIALWPAVLALTVACPSKPPGPAPIVAWHAYRGAERDALEQVARDFSAANPSTPVELLAIPYEAFADKLSASVPRGAGPDVFVFAHDRLGDWAASGFLESVDFWVDDALRDAFLPPTLDALAYDGQVFGLPLSFKTVALIRNTSLQPEAPATMSALLDAARAHTTGDRFGLVYEAGNFFFHAAWFHGFGARVFDEAGRPALDTPAAVRSFAFARLLATDAKVMPQEVTGTLVTTLFNQGRAAMVVSGPWFLGEVSKDVPYAVSPLPVLDETGERARPFLGVEGVFLSAKSSRKRASFAFMRHLSGRGAGRVLATVGRQSSANKAVHELPQVANDADVQGFRAQLAWTVPTPSVPAMRAVWSPATVALGKVVEGRATADAALRDAQAEVLKALQGARR